MNSLSRKIIRTFITALFILLLNLPILVMINTSLKTYSDVMSWPPTWFKLPLQWINYWEVLMGDKSIVTGLMNSLIVSSSAMVICVIVAVAGAYAVTRYQFWGKYGFLFTVILTQMFSPVLLSGPLYAIFNNLNLLNTRLSLIIANTASCLPMTVWLLYTYFQQVPIYLEEAAQLDGCNRGQAVWHVILPVSLPGILTAGIYAFISAWGDIVFARMSIIDRNLETIPLALVNFQEIYKTSWELQLAGSTISTIPIFILFMFIQRHLGKGLVQSGSKE